jgi:SET domain-containing protein
MFYLILRFSSDYNPFLAGAQALAHTGGRTHARPYEFTIPNFSDVSQKISPSSNRRIQTRRSGVHGKGVFAVQDIAEGETLMEYVGEVISWAEAQARHPHNPADPNHTFYFHIDENHVIDALFGGNSSRWINHACAPNCEAEEKNGRIFIKALRNIHAGEELNYDYGLIIDERYTAKLKAEYPCWCGADNCRGTLLAPKRGRR